jgi:uncharacterized membrane protein YhaH (DUF805 family)
MDESYFGGKSHGTRGRGAEKKTAVFALVGRFAKNPVRTYFIISFVFLVISFLPDIAAVSMPMPGAGWPCSITLMVMHVVAGVITVLMLTRLTVAEKA